MKVKEARLVPTQNKAKLTISEPQKAKIEWLRSTKRRLRENCQVLDDRKSDLLHIQKLITSENKNISLMISRAFVFKDFLESQGKKYKDGKATNKEQNEDNENEKVD